MVFNAKNMVNTEVMSGLPRNKQSSANTEKEIEYYQNLEKFFQSSIGSNVEKLGNFPKYVPRQSLAIFLAKYEIFKKIQNIQGSIVECGVLFGGGLMTFAQLSAILEPFNYQRRIIGFDTFSGFPTLSNQDTGSSSEFAHDGGLNIDSYEDLKKCIELYDANRFINHLQKVELVKGDANKTMPKYIEDNPHTIVSLLYIDFDIYEPTKTALETFVPRMPKGSVIAFDELNAKSFVGETNAVIDSIGIKNLKIERFNFDPNRCYAVLE